MAGRLIFGGLLVIWGVAVLTGWDIFRFVFPLILIWLGYRVITGKHSHFNWDKKIKSSQDEISEVLMLSGINKKIQSQDFAGGKITAILGGGEIDLTEVKTKNDKVELEIVAILGGMKLTIPKNWKVKSEAVAILGGFENNTTKGKDVDLILKGASILGGIEIVN